MNTLIVIALISLVYWKFKNQYYHRAALIYRYRLDNLKDKLYDFYLDDKVNVEDWQFKYLESSIEKTIDELPCLNIYLTFYLYVKHNGNPEYKNGLTMIHD